MAAIIGKAIPEQRKRVIDAMHLGCIDAKVIRYDLNTILMVLLVTIRLPVVRPPVIGRIHIQINLLGKQLQQRLEFA